MEPESSNTMPTTRAAAWVTLRAWRTIVDRNNRTSPPRRRRSGMVRTPIGQCHRAQDGGGSLEVENRRQPGSAEAVVKGVVSLVPGAPVDKVAPQRDQLRPAIGMHGTQGAKVVVGILDDNEVEIPPRYLVVLSRE